MPSKTIRFPDKLHDRIAAVAEREDRSFSYVVLRTLESALGPRPEVSRGADGGDSVDAGSPASSRAPGSKLDPSMSRALDSRAPVEKEPATPTEVVRRATSGPVPEIPDEPVPHQLPKRPAQTAGWNRAGRLR